MNANTVHKIIAFQLVKKLPRGKKGMKFTSKITLLKSIKLFLDVKKL